MVNIPMVSGPDRTAAKVYTPASDGMHITIPFRNIQTEWRGVISNQEEKGLGGLQTRLSSWCCQQEIINVLKQCHPFWRLVRPWSTCWRSSLYFPHNMNTAPRLKTHLSGATSAPGGGSAEAPDLDPGLVLLVHYCLAYPDTQLACWLLIYDGCPSRGDSQAPPPPPAQPRHTRRLIITTFQSLPTGSPSHLEDQELYFMCSTEVCSPADGDCIEGCFSGPKLDN
ncbi:uncharacterized protein LOC121568994 isoform X2 [Coregonus clupeaformis]|uniref:uncharacterized protein LOC121568994 isoform X2 n=1 Tax=Coregonus clupeaformis TaxID=59861 RepID=UPI001BE09C12|nr:uncharacterized protein LOC121568994 isoform X2 [Coregonus clupeaformis]